MALLAKFVLPLLFVIMATAANEVSPDPEADAIIQQADEKVCQLEAPLMIFPLELYHDRIYCRSVYKRQILPHQGTKQTPGLATGAIQR